MKLWIIVEEECDWVRWVKPRSFFLSRWPPYYEMNAQRHEASLFKGAYWTNSRAPFGIHVHSPLKAHTARDGPLAPCVDAGVWGGKQHTTVHRILRSVSGSTIFTTPAGNQYSMLFNSLRLSGYKSNANQEQSPRNYYTDVRKCYSPPFHQHAQHSIVKKIKN